MSDQFTPEFKHEALEADMQQLAAEIRRHRERPETRGLNEKELLKRSVASMTQPEGEKGSAAAPASPLPSYTDNLPAEAKLEIEYLLDLAFHKGIATANAEAKKSTPFVVDAFHDALVGKLYPELQKRGIIQ